MFQVLIVNVLTIIAKEKNYASIYIGKGSMRMRVYLTALLFALALLWWIAKPKSLTEQYQRTTSPSGPA